MGINGLWEILGDGEVWHIADFAADFFKKHNRPLRIAVDEACWRFRNLNAYQVEHIREGEASANPIEKVILQRVYRLLRLNIQLIFVDDGLRRPRKRGKAGGGKRDYELKKLTWQLLAQLKVPHHEAPGEAEAECARMQALGIVDAVWSDDGDSFMFGCGTLMKQHKQGNTNVKDHIRIYRAENILWDHDMDRESLVLFAVLAGGDYVQAGLPGCGPKTAAKVAARRVGLAHALCHAAKNELAKWREDLEHALRVRGKPVDVPWTFPDFKALGNYRSPNTSTDEQLHNLRGLRNGWDRQIDQRSLTVFLRHMFHFTTREFLKHIAPILVARRLTRASTPEQKAENVELGLQLKRTKKAMVKDGEDKPPAKSEVKVWFSPISLVEIELSSCPPEEDWTKFAAKDGTPYDPTQPVECELLDCFLKHGLPEGALVEAPSAARGRKRKAGAYEDKEGSPSSGQKKPRPLQEAGGDSPENAGEQKRRKPRKKPPADAATANKTSSKKKEEKQSDSKPRSSTPPPARFQLPKGLDELRAQARLVDLCDDDSDSASHQLYDSDEDEDLACAIQLSLRETQNSTANSENPSNSFDSSSRSFARYDDLPPSSASTQMVPASSPAIATPKGSDTQIRRQTTTATNLSHDHARPAASQVLIPGQSISAQALRDLRAGSSLLRRATTSATVESAPDIGNPISVRPRQRRKSSI